RSNEYTDVSAVAAALGGGGHARAAGVTMYEPYESAKEKILAALEKLV
ncbi:MAG: DHHA1 domain-containing protein, partial [Clostridia bacterium]|nr:DHHA1 domain-containing protein [Clostridia bacterium]